MESSGPAAEYPFSVTDWLETHPSSPIIFLAETEGSVHLVTIPDTHGACDSDDFTFKPPFPVSESSRRLLPDYFPRWRSKVLQIQRVVPYEPPSFYLGSLPWKAAVTSSTTIESYWENVLCDPEAPSTPCDLPGAKETHRSLVSALFSGVHTQLISLEDREIRSIGNLLDERCYAISAWQGCMSWVWDSGLLASNFFDAADFANPGCCVRVVDVGRWIEEVPEIETRVGESFVSVVDLGDRVEPLCALDHLCERNVLFGGGLSHLCLIDLEKREIFQSVESPFTASGRPTPVIDTERLIARRLMAAFSVQNLALFDINSLEIQSQVQGRFTAMAHQGDQLFSTSYDGGIAVRDIRYLPKVIREWFPYSQEPIRSIKMVSRDRFVVAADFPEFSASVWSTNGDLIQPFISKEIYGNCNGLSCLSDTHLQYLPCSRSDVDVVDQMYQILDENELFDVKVSCGLASFRACAALLPSFLVLQCGTDQDDERFLLEIPEERGVETVDETLLLGCLCGYSRIVSSASNAELLSLLKFFVSVGLHPYALAIVSASPLRKLSDLRTSLDSSELLALDPDHSSRILASLLSLEVTEGKRLEDLFFESRGASECDPEVLDFVLSVHPDGSTHQTSLILLLARSSFVRSLFKFGGSEIAEVVREKTIEVTILSDDSVSALLEYVSKGELAGASVSTVLSLLQHAEMFVDMKLKGVCLRRLAEMWNSPEFVGFDLESRLEDFDESLAQRVHRICRRREDDYY